MMKRYEVRRKIIHISRVYDYGKTTIPKEVREKLRIKDGDKLIWYEEDGRVFVKKLE